jgi:DNA invertase Pin-like site-specific DNA recombinase
MLMAVRIPTYAESATDRSLAELELELGRERRSAAREARRARGLAVGRPKVLDESKAALAQRMHATGEICEHHSEGSRGEPGNGV